MMMFEILSFFEEKEIWDYLKASNPWQESEKESYTLIRMSSFLKHL